MVKTPTLIGILGAPCSGKTELARRIEAALTGYGLTAVRTDDVARLAAAARGLPTMQHQTDQTTEWMISQGTADEIAAAALGRDVVLVDGVSISAFGDYLAAVQLRREQPDPFIARRLSQLVRDRAAVFDLLLATVFDPAEVSQQELADTQFSSLVDKHVHATLLAEKRPYLAVNRAEASHDTAIRRCVEIALRMVSAV